MILGGSLHPSPVNDSATSHSYEQKTIGLCCRGNNVDHVHKSQILQTKLKQDGEQCQLDLY